MAEYHYSGGVKGYSALELEEYKRNSLSGEFNPRAPPSVADQWPAPPFPAEPPILDSDAPPPTWWASSSPPPPTSPTPPTYGRGRPLHHCVSAPAADLSRISMHSNAAQVPVKDGCPPALLFPADLNRNNPYLDAALRSPSASWRQMQHQPQQQQQVSTATEEWGCTGNISSRNSTYHQSARPGLDQERGVFHPVFADQRPVSAYHVVQPARATHNLQQLANANRPPACPSYANMMMDVDGNFKTGDNRHGWGTDQLERSAGKSQSMRALYEENAALRRALYSMRRGSFQDHSLGLQQGEQDRCITSDAAEGRTLSMRERGRWAMHAAGDVVAAGGSCPVWAGTPRRQWAAGLPVHGMQAGAGTHQRDHHHHQNQWWEDIAAEHPLFYAGGSFAGWPEDYPHWADVQNECQSGIADEAVNGEGTSLKQLLVETDRAAGLNGHKWRRHGKKKASRSCAEEVVGSKLAEEEGQCAMCGGKLRHVEVGGKKAGLPLRLCPACHPRAAASLPHSTTTKSPPLTSQTRHHVATTILMACRPTNTNNQPPTTTPHHPKHPSNKMKPKSRIVDLCRHFVGLSAKPTPPTS
eukprot:c20205_g1_i1 orf=172-1920(-)